MDHIENQKTLRRLIEAQSGPILNLHAGLGRLSIICRTRRQLDEIHVDLMRTRAYKQGAKITHVPAAKMGETTFRESFKLDLPFA